MNTTRESCPGGWEAHQAHMEMNGDCPWCGAFDKSKWLTEEELAALTPDEIRFKRWERNRGVTEEAS